MITHYEVYNGPPRCNEHLTVEGPGDCDHPRLSPDLCLNTRSDRGLTEEKTISKTQNQRMHGLSEWMLKGQIRDPLTIKPMDDLGSQDLVMIFMIEVILTLPGR